MKSVWDKSLSLPFPAYHDVHSRWGRDADAVIIRFAKTPTGRWSKYWCSLQLNRDNYGRLCDSDEFLERKAESMHIPRLRKGYTWSEPFRYS